MVITPYALDATLKDTGIVIRVDYLQPSGGHPNRPQRVGPQSDEVGNIPPSHAVIRAYQAVILNPVV